jgi:hypothetical protein
MVACADDSLRSGKGRVRRIDDDRMNGEEEEGEDASTMIAADPDTTPVPQEVDVWAMAEGYTPLGDLLLGNLGSVMVSMPPEEGEEDDDDVYDSPGHGHAFMASPHTLFGAVAATLPGNDSDDDKDDDDDDDGQPGTLYTSRTNDTDNANFRDVANNALMALENEYMATLSMPAVALSSLPPLLDSAEAVLEIPSFDVDFEEHLPAFTIPPLPKKEMPQIDTLAVQKAMTGIKANAGLDEKLQKWEEEQKRKKSSQQQHHSVIPDAPLKAFRKKTAKAIQATTNLSRSATIAECFHRLSYLLQSQDRLVIHIVGADPMECQSEERVRATFSPLAKWIDQNIYSPRHLSVCLVGPNVPSKIKASDDTPIHLLPPSCDHRRLWTAEARCYQANYHIWLSEQDHHAACADLVVCFNAGIWGYDEWKPTLRYLVERNAAIPFVITSYTLEEAEDDFDVMDDMVKECPNLNEGGENTSPLNARHICLWGPEVNAFASKQERETATAVQGRDYRENHAWQAWRL